MKRTEQNGELKAVEMMRSIRDELSQKLMHMSYDEQKRYMAARLEGSEVGQPSSKRKRA